MVGQSFVQNLNLVMIQVSASGNSLVPTHPQPLGPPPIPPFIITDTIIAVQYFVRQSTRHQCSYNSVSSVSINGRPHNGPVYDDKGNRLT